MCRCREARLEGVRVGLALITSEFTEVVPHHDDRRGPHHSAEDAVEEEPTKGNAAHPGNQSSEQAGDREETGREDGFTTVAPKEPFDSFQALWGELHIPPPLQDERPSPFVARPVTDLTPDDGPDDAEHYGLPKAQVALLNQHAGGQEDGRARERDPRAPEH